MIKTFEQFSQSYKEMYTPEEYEMVYEIVSEYYMGEDIEDFIHSPDVEVKEEFIDENELENLRVWGTCGKFITEGYIYRDFETYCSDEWFKHMHGYQKFENADEDELYWTAWEG